MAEGSRLRLPIRLPLLSTLPQTSTPKMALFQQEFEKVLAGDLPDGCKLQEKDVKLYLFILSFVTDRFFFLDDDFKEPSGFGEKMIRFVWTKADEVNAKMMYVSGETAEPSTETTGMVEEIVRQQVIEMVRSLLPPSLIYLTL
jgi:hypothetical protein